MSEVKRFSLVNPTTKTPFHIDFNWWQQHDNNWRVHMLSCLCSDHQKALANSSETAWIDWVDPQTAEVQQVDGLQHLLMTHCAKQVGFITNQTLIVDAVFRIFLANGNKPLTPEELAELTHKSAITILRTFSNQFKIFKGIRPILG